MTVSPPPGVSSSASAPTHRGDEAVGRSSSPSPTPSPLRSSPRRWNGSRHLTSPFGGDARSVVDDAHVHLVAQRRCVDSDRGRRVRVESPGVGKDVGERALQQDWVGVDEREVSGQLARRSHSSCIRRCRPRPRTASTSGVGRSVDRECAGLQSAGVEQVADQAVEAVGLGLDGGERVVELLRRSSRTSGSRSPLTIALIDANGLRRSCDTERSIAVRTASMSAEGRRIGGPVGRVGGCSTATLS